MNLTDFEEAGVMRYYKPNKNRTLQEEYKRLVGDDPYCLATPKSDGNWSRYIVRENGVIIQSRTISKVSGERLTYHEKLVGSCYNPLKKLPNSVFLGEMIRLDVPTSAKTCRNVLGCLPTKSLQNQVEHGMKMGVVLFDCLCLGGISLMHLGYEDRQRILRLSYETALSDDEKKIIQYKSPILISSLEEAHALFEIESASGREGLILVKKDALYIPSKSAKRGLTLKFKRHDEADLVCIGWDPPTREYNGKNKEGWAYKIDGECVSKAFYHDWPCGSLRFGAYSEDGDMVVVCNVSGITDDMKANPEEYINKVFKINYFSYDESECSLREPKIVELHSDKNASECLLSDLK